MEISLSLRMQITYRASGNKYPGLHHLRERKERFRSGRPERECTWQERLQQNYLVEQP